MQRSKAFFINGGAGRVVCSIPAFEKYQEESGDTDFIIVCEGGSEIFKGHPTLDSRVYDAWHKNIFKDQLVDREIISLEPYRIWEYYNQKCNLSQAFDLEINKKGIRDLGRPTLSLSKEELISGRMIISEVKKKTKKEKIVVFQPFGRGVEYVDETLIDRSGRSFELKDVKTIIKKLQETGWGVVVMSEFKIDLSSANLKDEIAFPEGVNIRQWAGTINFADHFLGCDSLGQHLAYAVEKQSTIVTGSTFPVNITYTNCEYFNVLDMGEFSREYSPIRITVDERVDRNNENIMSMNQEIVDLVVDHVNGKKQDKEET